MHANKSNQMLCWKKFTRNRQKIQNTSHGSLSLTNSMIHNLNDERQRRLNYFGMSGNNLVNPPQNDLEILSDMENLIGPVGDDEAAMQKSLRSSLDDPALYNLYQATQRKYFDFILIIPLTILFFGAAVTRFDLDRVGSDGLMFSLEFSVLLVASVYFFSYMVSRMIVKYTPKTKRHWKCYHNSKYWLNICYKGRIEDVIGLSGTMIVGTCLLGRVYAGQCPNIDDIWATQRCNPFADMQSIPQDQVILLYLCPIMVQCVMRGITFQALVSIWSLSLIFVVLASHHVGGYLQLWTICYSVIFMIITFMIERLMRVTFVQGRAMLAAVNLKNKHELDLRELYSENERKLKEREMCQLRSLMGNVAHDLKTPLHSIEADLEVLNVFISKISLTVAAVARTEIDKKGYDGFNPQSVFDSLNATCKFMAMAINRSQDFMKASNNVALVPVMETFELATAMTMSVTCMNHLQSDRTITVYPLDDVICSHIISDKHWLCENALCLLSNAMKYSDDGEVVVRMNLIEVPMGGSEGSTADSTDRDVNSPVLRDSDLSNHGSSTLGQGRSSDGGDSSINGNNNNYNSSNSNVIGNGINSNSITHNNTSAGNTASNSVNSRNASATSDKIHLQIEALNHGINHSLHNGSFYISNPNIHNTKMKKMILISVEDAGIGIAEEARKNLFQPFKQAQRMAGGTGLGLYSLLKRIDALGGKCGCADRTDGKQGSNFWFTFPYRPDHAAKEYTAQMKEVVEASPDNIDGLNGISAGTGESVRNSFNDNDVNMIRKSILVVDDSLSVLKVTSRLLKMNGHTIDTAYNGSVGLKLLKETFDEHVFDMVLTDLQMPVMDGIEATSRFRKFEEEMMIKELRDPLILKKRKRMLIIGMSANSDSVSKQEALKSGMDYFVTKPFSYKDLESILINHAGNSSTV